MRGGVSSSAGQIIRRMRQRQQAVTRELTAAAREIGPLVNAESKRVMQDGIYSVPIPLKAGAEKRFGTQAKIRQRTTKGKHGAWQRTGNLKRQELWKVEGPTVILTNNAAYALARFRLGTSEGRQIISTGVKSVQWQTQAVQATRDRILAIRRRRVLRALGM